MASMLCGPASQHHHHARLCPRPLCTPQFPAPTTCIQVPGDFLTAKTLNILCAVPNCHLFILSHRGTRQHHFKWFVLFTIHAHYSHSLPAQFKENVGHIFVDSTPLVKLPEVNATSTYYATHYFTLKAGLVNIATVDVLLLSNCFSLLALPYLTEVRELIYIL